MSQINFLWEECPYQRDGLDGLRKTLQIALSEFYHKIHSKISQVGKQMDAVQSGEMDYGFLIVQMQ